MVGYAFRAKRRGLGWSYKFWSHQWVYDPKSQKTACITSEVTEVWAWATPTQNGQEDEWKPADETEKQQSVRKNENQEYGS